MPQPCSVSENTIDTDQSSFWDSSNLHWDSHKIGWAVAGGCTILVCSITWMFFLVSCSILSVRLQTILISLVSIIQHCRYAQAEVTQMLSLMHGVRLGITQIQGNSDRCQRLFLNALLASTDDRLSPQFTHSIHAPSLCHRLFFFIQIFPILHLLLIY